MLISVSELPMHLQKNQIQKIFNDWKGELEQVDDICIFSMKI